jgi:hypothetical protein
MPPYCRGKTTDHIVDSVAGLGNSKEILGERSESTGDCKVVHDRRSDSKRVAVGR